MQSSTVNPRPDTGQMEAWMGYAETRHAPVGDVHLTKRLP